MTFRVSRLQNQVISNVVYYYEIRHKEIDMAKLFINKDIAADSDKIMYWLSGDDCVSYNDIHSFLDSYSEDPKIDVELHSCGGSCIEGYAIYDALRASGKEISCTVVGTCASMATVILLAAPLERRSMYPNARLLIHNPYYPCLDGMATIESMESALESLKNEKERMLAVYVERTGKSREELEAQMTRNDWFGSDRAIELGFISHVIPAASASANNNNKNRLNMNGKKISVAEAFKMLGIALGITKDAPVGLSVTTSTGDTLTVEREEGEMQVGDSASPDGTHVLEDGRTVIVTDGVITEIKEAEQANEDEEGKAKAEESTEEEMNALKSANDALKAQVEELQNELEALKAGAKSEAETRILAAVEKAGGEEWLTKAAASTYTPAGRSNTGAKPAEKVSKVERLLAEAKERNKERFEAKVKR